MENNKDDFTRHHHQPPPPPPLQMVEEDNNEIRNVMFNQIINDSDSRNNQFPLARIKKIMKSDPEVSMISSEAPVLFSKACEMFVVDLTNRAWLHAEDNKRRTLQKSDISVAVASDYIYDFLLDIVPGENDSFASGSAVNRSLVAMPHHDSVGLPVYYPPPGFVMGTPVVNCNGMYAPPELQSWSGGKFGESGEDEAESSGGKSGEN